VAAEDYDAIVIGTSQGGRFLPLELAKTGQKVALVERGQLGGVCVNTGCTPTETMVASARLAYQARRGAEYGVHFLVRCRWTWPRCASANGPWSPARGRTT
jgi:pyruvate/2-oxoglutarate dehydrogenase complex dihydrolipoamide dehydrogenase (E3) component